ncbi:hypothetical protein M3Y97_01126700 [Aphelenchoides bicaudatus]|nr:hypothetical protein M3Y97_01126700 [Aphelenchoides bicaudatus]
MPFKYPDRQSISRLFGSSSNQMSTPTIAANLPTIVPSFFNLTPTENNDETNRVVDQEQVEKAERRIWGLFVMRISHFTGLHPIRAPFFCTEEQCVKLSLSQRLSIIDIVMWTVNFFTCANHIYLKLMHKGLLHFWVTSDKSVFLLRESIGTLYPLFILLITLTNSAGLDRLLHLLAQTKREISQSKNNQRIKRWRMLMIMLNALFLTAFVANFTVILLHNVLNDEDDIDDSSNTSTPQLRSAFTCLNSTVSVLSCFDDAYFEVMAFCVGEIPRIFIMMMAIELGFLFKENANMVAGKRLTRDRLIDFHENFQKANLILSQLETTFNKLILFVVSCTIAMMTLNSYVVLRYFFSSYNGNSEGIVTNTLTILFNINLPESSDRTQMCNVILFVETANFFLKMSWTLGFIIACVWCNEKSRSALPHLLNSLAQDDAKPTKDQLVQKLQDFNWGITMGKFMRVERSVLFTMVSIAFTVVIVWLQWSSKH